MIVYLAGFHFRGRFSHRLTLCQPGFLHFLKRLYPHSVDDAHAAAAQHLLDLVGGDVRQVGGRPGPRRGAAWGSEGGNRRRPRPPAAANAAGRREPAAAVRGTTGRPPRGCRPRPGVPPAVGPRAGRPSGRVAPPLRPAEAPAPSLEAPGLTWAAGWARAGRRGRPTARSHSPRSVGGSLSNPAGSRRPARSASTCHCANIFAAISRAAGESPNRVLFQTARSARNQSHACWRRRARSASLSLAPSLPSPHPATVRTGWRGNGILCSDPRVGRQAVRLFVLAREGMPGQVLGQGRIGREGVGI